ncbi:MAG: SET domain-containing protein [Elainellaceae cyanobacterium]
MVDGASSFNDASGFLSPEMFPSLVDNAPKCQPGISKIQGYGLIAAEKIVAQEKIIDFSNSEIYTERRFSELEPWRLQGGKYTGLSEEMCLTSNQFTKYSLLNHSRNPNAVLDLKQRCIVALKDILPGEEVATDYRLEPVSPEAKAYIQDFL